MRRSILMAGLYNSLYSRDWTITKRLNLFLDCHTLFGDPRWSTSTVNPSNLSHYEVHPHQRWWRCDFDLLRWSTHLKLILAIFLDRLSHFTFNRKPTHHLLASATEDKWVGPSHSRYTPITLLHANVEVS